MKKLSVIGLGLIPLLFMANASASQCVVKKYEGDKETSVKKFDQKKFVYEYSDQKFVTVQYSFSDKEFYKISYQSLPNKAKPDEYTSYELTCDKYLSCEGQKKSNYSYYKNVDQLELKPSGYAVALFQGGRDMFSLVAGNQEFSAKFIDLQVADGKWYGLSIKCSN